LLKVSDLNSHEVQLVKFETDPEHFEALPSRVAAPTQIKRRKKESRNGREE
jgi:hypothetical protein